MRGSLQAGVDRPGKAEPAATVRRSRNRCGEPAPLSCSARNGATAKQLLARPFERGRNGRQSTCVTDAEEQEGKFTPPAVLLLRLSTTQHHHFCARAPLVPFSSIGLDYRFRGHMSGTARRLLTCSRAAPNTSSIRTFQSRLPRMRHSVSTGTSRGCSSLYTVCARGNEEEWWVGTLLETHEVGSNRFRLGSGGWVSCELCVSNVCLPEYKERVTRRLRSCFPQHPNHIHTCSYHHRLSRRVSGWERRGERPQVVARRCGVLVCMWRTS